jgi:uncharacterized protein
MANFPLASIPATEVRRLQSSAVDQEYLISVALPFHYEEHPEKRYPMIYVLDGNMYFEMVVEMVRLMNLCNELPDAIIIGIGYPVNGSLAASYAQVMHLRIRDFLPVRDEKGEKFIHERFPIPNPIVSGGGERFLQFIQQELVPLIEAEYRADPADRTLIGHSWGGEFAYYTLFYQPDLFQRYVVVSAVPTFDYEQIYADHHDTLPVRMYMACGEPELEGDMADFNLFASTMESRGYAGFRLTHQLFASCTHCAVVAPAFQVGLVAVFA